MYMGWKNTIPPPITAFTTIPSPSPKVVRRHKHQTHDVRSFICCCGVKTAWPEQAGISTVSPLRISTVLPRESATVPSPSVHITTRNESKTEISFVTLLSRSNSEVLK